MGDGIVVLPETFNWSEVYSYLGLTEHFATAADRLRPANLLGFCAVPVLPEVDTQRLDQAYAKSGLGLRLGKFGLIGDQVRHSRWPAPGPYLIYLRRGNQPDQCHLGKSVFYLEECGVNGVNLVEYLLFFLAVLLTTGQHLDTETSTLCNGTSAAGYLFPSVYFDSEEKVVAASWVNVNFTSPRLGIRQVAC